jgi:diaminopimelate epimerase
MKIPFIKLEGLGNSYVFIQTGKIAGNRLKKMAVIIADPKRGIGSDGLILMDIRRESFRMRIFNKDGSEAEMCGNGLRQAALYLNRLRFPRRKSFAIKTLAGNFEARIVSSRGNEAIVETSLGAPDFSSAAVGLKIKKGLAFDVPLIVHGGKRVKGDAVSMGNPHVVIFVKEYNFGWAEIGRKISESSRFAGGTNVHFIKVIGSGRFEMKTYERGSGVTAACGSGAAACLAAGVMRNLLNKKAVAVMSGGKLRLFWNLSSNMIYQLGPVRVVCRGEFFI